MAPVTKSHRLAVARAWEGKNGPIEELQRWADAGNVGYVDGAFDLFERLAQLVADAEGAWILSPVEPPAVDSFAWVIWNGVVQDQPWQWLADDEGEPRFFFDGHTLQLDEVDAYSLIAPLAAPKPPESP